VKASELKPIGYKARAPLSPAWRELLARISHTTDRSDNAVVGMETLLR
jgi:hypothetical protein